MKQRQQFRAQNQGTTKQPEIGEKTPVEAPAVASNPEQKLIDVLTREEFIATALLKAGAPLTTVDHVIETSGEEKLKFYVGKVVHTLASKEVTEQEIKGAAPTVGEILTKIPSENQFAVVAQVTEAFNQKLTTITLADLV